jgi:phenylalanyl-tRNA synthetase beta chain
MRFSWSWLRELSGVGEAFDAAEAGRLLTAAGMSVEAIEPAGEGAGADLAFDADVTTNRPDAMCHRGLARELAAVAGGTLQPLPSGPLGERVAAPEGLVTIECPTLCRRYAAVIVRGVTVGPSPEWLQRRLLAIGARPISNVVDATNYVMWELGQPTHAFDLATLVDRRVVVREARDGERLTTLDGVERELAAGMVVIADRERAIGLGGVMGGQNTEVGPGTTEVLVESAWFDPSSVRRTAKRLGMHTDASHRFERGADPEAQVVAAERVAALLVEIAGGTVVAATVDARGEALPPQERITLSSARLDRFAGVAIPPAAVERLLGAVGFDLQRPDATEASVDAMAPVEAAPRSGQAAPQPAGGVRWSVAVPSWRRFDVLEEADLFEEALRLHGFDAVPSALPAVGGPDAPELPTHALRRHLREELAAAGFAEAIDWAFYGASDDIRFATPGAPGPALALVNPLSERHALMRRSLLPVLLEAATYNRRRGAPAVRLFEVGHVFWRGADGLPNEAEQLAIVCGGRLGTPWERPAELDLFDLKGIVEALGEGFGRRLEARPATLPGLAPGRAATLHAAGGGEVVGILGQVAESAEGYPLFVAELATAAFLPLPAPARVVPPPRVPGIAIDTTLTHALDVPWAALAAAIDERRPAELVEVALENRYQGPGVPAGAVNTTIHFVYHAGERTLTQDEVNERHGALAAHLAERFGWRAAG